MGEKSHIPAGLTAHDHWICWRNECEGCYTVHPPDVKTCRECGDNTTKRPINPKTGEFANPTGPETWTDHDTAAEYNEKSDTHGLGYVFSADDNLTGIDLDDCRDPDTGELEDWAVDIVRQLNSFTEVSPSGTGLHIYAYGEMPDEGGNRRDGVEMYDDEHYFTVTGDHIARSPGAINYREEEIESVHEGHINTGDRAAADLSDVDVELPESEPEGPFENDLGMSLEEVRDREPRIDIGLEEIEPDYETVGRDNPSDASPSGYDYSLAGLLHFWRFSPQQIVDIFHKYRYRPKVERPETYLGACTGEQYDPRPDDPDETVDILGDREQYPSITQTDLPDGHFVLDKPPREGGSHASIEHLLRNGNPTVILVSRHTIAEHHLEILDDILPDQACAVHLAGKHRACDHSGKVECPREPESLQERLQLENEVRDIVYRKTTVTPDDAPEDMCKYEFVKEVERQCHTVVTVPQLLGSLDRDFEECNLLIDEEQALSFFRPGSTNLVEIIQKYEPDGAKSVQLVSSNISTQFGPLEKIREQVHAEQQERKEIAEEEGRDWRRTSWEIDIENAIDYIEELKHELGVTDTVSAIQEAGGDITAKATIDTMLDRLSEIDRPRPHTNPDDFRDHLSDYTAPYFHQEDVNPGGIIESVLFPYEDRPFDFKRTGRGHTLRMIGGRTVFHRSDLREFNQIGIIAGPEGELLFDDLDLDATTVLITDFLYADDFVVVPIGKESQGGELESPRSQRKRAKRVCRILNERSHPHLAIAGTKDRADELQGELDKGMASVVGNPPSPAKDMRTLWSAGQTAIIYENSGVSRGVDAPMFDVSVVVSTGFATPYWEARTKHYEGEDDDEYLYASAIESQLKSRELTNAVLRPSPTRGTEDYCGTKFIVASHWDSHRLKYLQDRMVPRFAYAENAANFIEQLTIPGGLRQALDEIYDEVDGNERRFIEITMVEEMEETVYDRPWFGLDELEEWRENRCLTANNDLDKMKKVVPMNGGEVSGKHIRNVLSEWNGMRIRSVLEVLERKGLFDSYRENDGSRGRPSTFWEWSN